MVRLVSYASILFSVLAFLLLDYLPGQEDGFGYDERGRLYDLGRSADRVAAPHEGRRLKVLTWNIAYGYGKGSEAETFEPKDAAWFAGRLDRIAAFIKELDADVVLLQEVDFKARRSHDQDQLALIKRACGYAYAAAAVSWSARYVPYPFGAPSRHVGRIASGGAILSRFPLGEHRVTYHPQPAGNPFWYNAYYLRRYTQSAEIHAFGGTFAVLNNHLEYGDAAASSQAIDVLARKAAESPAPLVIGGDFNATPEEVPLKMLRRVPQIEDAMLSKGIPDGDPRGFTYPADAGTMRIDHLFIRRGVEVEDLKIIQAGDLSDHLPVIATLVIGDS